MLTEAVALCVLPYELRCSLTTASPSQHEHRPCSFSDIVITQSKQNQRSKPSLYRALFDPTIDNLPLSSNRGKASRLHDRYRHHRVPILCVPTSQVYSWGKYCRFPTANDRSRLHILPICDCSPLDACSRLSWSITPRAECIPAQAPHRFKNRRLRPHRDSRYALFQCRDPLAGQ